MAVCPAAGLSGWCMALSMRPGSADPFNPGFAWEERGFLCCTGPSRIYTAKEKAESRGRQPEVPSFPSSSSPTRSQVSV